jgi:hypothetical protein
MVIPEDLKVWYSVACDEVHFATDYKAIKTLIERIAANEARIAELERQLAEMREPVSDKEWPRRWDVLLSYSAPSISRHEVNSLLAARFERIAGGNGRGVFLCQEINRQ